MKNKVLFVLCLLAGLLFIIFGLNKFLNYMPAPKDMPEKMIKVGTAFMEIGWLMPLVGTMEVVGGLLLIIPRTRALGAIVLVPILTGIVLANINMAPSALPMTFALVAIIVWVIVENRARYLPMIQK
jgi:uncharacterized membrane protein YphA (DoxX/SURF4 family)